MKVIVSDFDGTLYNNNQILYEDKINEFVKDNIFIIATGRNMSSLKKDLDKFNINVSFYICNDGALIMDQYFNIIYRKDLETEVVRPIYNDLKNDDNMLEVLLDTVNGYVEDVNRSINKIIARYFDREEAINLVNKINTHYPSVFAYLSNNWVNITKRTETKGSAIEFLENYYNLSKFPIYVIGNDINDISMCNSRYISYGIKCDSNKYQDKFNNIVASFEDAFDEINE